MRKSTGLCGGGDRAKVREREKKGERERERFYKQTTRLCVFFQHYWKYLNVSDNDFQLVLLCSVFFPENVEF